MSKRKASNKRSKFTRFEFDDVISSSSNETQDLVKQLLEEINNHKPWEWSDQWENEEAYLKWLRGLYRDIWYKWSPKNKYINDNCFDYPNLDDDGKEVYVKSGKNKGKVRTKKHVKCELTGKILPKTTVKVKGETLRGKTTKYQVDHIKEAGSFNSVLESFVYLLKLLTGPDNMRVLSTEAHSVVTYMAKYSKSWEEAIIDKKVIAWDKDKFVDHKGFLTDKGYAEGEVSNSSKRKECYRKYLISIGDTELD